MLKYIWELEDWPHFRWDERALSAEIARVSFRQGLLIGRLEALGFGDQQEATLQALIQEVRRSSEIEGELLDEAQVRSSIAKQLGMDIAGLPRSDRDVDGIVEIVLDATQRYPEPLTKERLWNWHALLFPLPRHRNDRMRVGAWRSDEAGPMQVVSGPMGQERVHFQAPPAERLDAEVDRFLEWFEDSESTVVKAGLAHLWFETLHPFDDGNGRIGRAVMDMVLARSENRSWRGYSISAQIRKERKRYYDFLERAQLGSMDATPWLQWYLECLSRALESSERVLEAALARSKFWNSHAGKPISSRQRAVLARVLAGFDGKLTNDKWSKLAKVSHDTALRDIKDLVAKGILMPSEAGGRSTHYELAM